MTKNDTANLFEPVRRIAGQCTEILDEFQSVPKLFDASCRRYRQVCTDLPEQLRAGRLKIAVVGVIKSGKSTFVNALIGKEIVQRGAGVMTSITTRIRKGSRERAMISFKSWDQVNAQIEDALKYFPYEKHSTPLPKPFDLRRTADRSVLRQIYEQMLSSFPMADGVILPETLVIRHALDGFEHCRNLVEADEQTLTFSAFEFHRHRDYTADADRAFYVRDVLLETDDEQFGDGIEIADCQGSDSTDPAGIRQVLDYIDKADLIIYCISSRNGLRQSDLVFFEKIRTMGMTDRVLVVNNCDFTEHENVKDLQEIESRIRKDLALFKKELPVFSFSCLYLLFDTLKGQLSARQAGQIALWDQDPLMVEYADRQYTAFLDYLNSLKTRHRDLFLSQVQLSRLDAILSKLNERLTFFAQTLDTQQLSKSRVQQKNAKFHAAAQRLESIVNNSIDAAIQGLTAEIKTNLDHRFSEIRPILIQKAVRFIDQLQFDVTPYRRLAGDNSLNKMLYLLFHDFRRRFEIFIIEAIKPEVQQRVMEQEKAVAAHFEALLNSYRIDFFNPGSDLSLNTLPGASLPGDPDKIQDAIDFERIREVLGLAVPDQVFQAQYSASVRSRVWLQFFLTTISDIFSSVTDKRKRFSFTPGLKQADLQIKQFTKTRLRSQIDAYQQAVLDRHLMPLIDAAARDFKKILSRRFSEYKSLKTQLDQLLELQAEEQKKHRKKVLELKMRVEKTMRTIAELPRHPA